MCSITPSNWMNLFQLQTILHHQDLDKVCGIHPNLHHLLRGGPLHLPPVHTYHIVVCPCSCIGSSKYLINMSPPTPAMDHKLGRLGWVKLSVLGEDDLGPIK